MLTTNETVERSVSVIAGLCVSLLLLSACAGSRNLPGGNEKASSGASNYTVGIPVSADSNAGDDCAFQRPESADLISRPYANMLRSEIALFSRPDSGCSSATKSARGQDVQVIARRGEWVFVQNLATTNEGWANLVALGELKLTGSCIKLERASAGIRFKNICDRDIAEMRVCISGGRGQPCRTKWYTVGKLEAGKSRRLSNTPRPSGQTWWLFRGCFEPGALTGEGTSAQCR